jgi:formylglycine-generating enzyme required for sulfatase activity
MVKVSIPERVAPNNYKLYNMIGNVAEMTMTKGVAKGGSWMDKNEDCMIRKNTTYSTDLPWLGFRCVCELRKL